MKELRDIINQSESQTIEFKTSFQKELIESVVAFANAKGGKVLIGVSDGGDIIGVGLKAESLQNMNTIEISNMHLQSLQLSWDAYVANDTVLEDLDQEKINQFFNRVNSKGRFKLNGTLEENLTKLNLLNTSKPTNAAKLLFAKDMTLYSIHLGRFKTPSMILDDKMIKTTLFEAVEESMRFILSHLKVAFEFTGAVERKEILEYPQKALREIVLNAIVHRDYTNPVDIQIKIFDNSITIFNPGKLYGDLTVEDLHTNIYQSRARNKLIAEAFYLTGDIEKYGSGYIRVREEIKNYPTMQFEYREIGDGYLVTLHYTKQKTTTQETTQETTRDKIIRLLQENNKYSKKELMRLLNKGDSTIKEHLNRLKRDGIIKRIGSTKTGYWEVTINDK